MTEQKFWRTYWGEIIAALKKEWLGLVAASAVFGAMTRARGQTNA